MSLSRHGNKNALLNLPCKLSGGSGPRVSQQVGSGMETFGHSELQAPNPILPKKGIV